MSAATQSTRSARPRPTTLAAAVVIAVFNALIPFPLLPTVNGLDGFIVGVTAGIGVLLLAGAWGLWQGSKWGAIGLFVVSALNALLSFGSIFNAAEGSPDALDRVLGALMTVTSLAVCGLIVHRATRRALS